MKEGRLSLVEAGGGGPKGKALTGKTKNMLMSVTLFWGLLKRKRKRKKKRLKTRAERRPGDNNRSANFRATQRGAGAGLSATE